MRLERLRRHSKALAIGLLIPFMATLFPTQSYAITSGPAQEEFATFTPAQTTEMVNLYSGDFSYNIPLLTVPGPSGGYPVNLFYNSGANVNEAGSWVGYGWNLNVGAINRQLRGLPDDFNGEEIKRETHIKSSFGVGIDIPTSSYRELAGLPSNPSDGVGWNMNIYYNNYKGLGLRSGLSFTKGNFGIGLSYDSQNGIGIDPSFQFGTAQGTTYKESGLSIGLNSSYNSRKGLQSITVNPELTYEKKKYGPGEDAEITGGMGASANANLSFGFTGSVPEVDIETNTTQIDFDFKVGKESLFPVFKVSPIGKWSGFVEWTNLVNDGVLTNPGFGYLHTQNAVDNGLKDFNRSQLPYSKKVPNLAPSFYTYDLLSVTGEGVGGMFRPYRSKVEVLNTPLRTNKITGYKVIVEIGKGLTPPPPATPLATNFHFGFGFAQTSGKTYSGIWKDENAIGETFVDTCPECGEEPGFEPAFYKLFGEQNGRLETEDDQLAHWSGTIPVRPSIVSSSVWSTTGDFENNLVSNENVNTTDDHFGVVPQRTPKANEIQTLNAYQAYQYGFSKNLFYFDLASSISKPKFEEPPVKDSEKISEMIVTKNDGMRYVYGLPAMNKEQADAIFNVYPTPPYKDINGEDISDPSAINIDVITGVNTNTTNLSSNQYLSKTHLPEYAHSWLLTNIFSPDYADKTGDGPSVDDPGSWIEFKYKKVAGSYKWREPYEGANFIQGMKSDPKDDMAAYSYGEKELFYLDTIETATHLAIFITSTRDDAADVIDEAAGGRSSLETGNRMHKLDEIKLYIKPGGSMPDFDNDIPLQTIKFTYAENGSTEQLCKSLPSASEGNGKLTLIMVSVTTDMSTRGSLSPYKFTYGGSDGINPNFNRQNRDRWGNFQDNVGAGYGENYPFVDFAYTDQYNEPEASAWQLTQIQLPTGGQIKVEYESDDYAYEMDKPAALMLDIVGTEEDDANISAADRFADGDISAGLEEGSKIYLKLPKELPSELDTDEKKAYVGRHYVGGLRQIYFKVLSQLKDGEWETERDYVAGYFELDEGTDSYGVENESIIWIKARRVDVQNPSFNQTIHPIQRANLEHLRANRPELVYEFFQGQVAPDDFVNQIGNVLGSVIKSIEEAAIIFMGFNRYGKSKDWGNKIYLNGRSIIRLQDGSGFMYGGGNRVKSIHMNNNWSKGAGPDKYGQQFDYTIDENDGRGKISSGVAITPQDTGGDECALLTPADYESSSKLVSPFNLFVEKPVMRNYYPAAGVGYRKVTVKSYADQIEGLPDIDASYAPTTEHEFFTHKDFPVFESQTDLSSDSPVFDWAYFIIGGRVEKKIGRSQGYTVELNNMAGVQKSVNKLTRPTDVNPAGTLISKVEYVYNTEEQYSDQTANRLSSSIKIVGPVETLVDGKIGETHDIFHDFHENSQESKQFGGEIDLDLSFVPPSPFPLFAPFFAPAITLSSTSVRTVVTHKIIYRTGILKAVKATDGLSTITTENIAYDRTTARPILTRATNEFKDYVYSYSQPAHWYYNGMEGAYQNLGVSIKVEGGATDGEVTLVGDEVDYFNVGDEVWVENEGGGGDIKMYVTAVETGESTINGMDKDGNDVSWTGDRTLTIFRSGHRNLLTAAAGNMSFWGASDVGQQDPEVLEANKGEHFDDRYQNLLNISSTTFKDQWPAGYCNSYLTNTECQPELTSTGINFNGLLNSILGCQGLLQTQNISTCDEISLYSSGIINEVCGLDDNTPDGIYYVPTVEPSTNALTVTFSTLGCPSCCENCAISIAAPSSNFDWSDVFHFNEITPTGDGQYTINITANESGYDVGISSDCLEFSACTSTEEYVSECEESNNTTNPFLTGEKGNWRPYESFAYKTYRNYASNVMLREYSRFGIEAGNEFDWAESSSSNEANGWVLASRATKYSPYGNLLEEQDALGTYSSAQFGYLKQLAVAVCGNARYQEIGSDNFEDYDKDCTDHFKFSINSPANITSNEAHTGKRSIEVYANNSPFMIKGITQVSEDPPVETCLGTFSPTENKRYIVSAWVKEKNLNGSDIRDASSYKYPSIDVKSGGGASSTVTLKPSGEIVDGWQRIFEEVTIPNLPSGNNFIEIRLVNNAKDNRAVYFDDVRVHPFNGSMKTFVYNPLNLRLMAMLDENNYATFYLRDQEGQVVKYNVETEKGIVTIKEGTRHLAPPAN